VLGEAYTQRCGLATDKSAPQLAGAPPGLPPAGKKS
jgi:hypothetical protein